MAKRLRPFEAFGKNLIRLRTAKQFTQERLSEKIGISLKYYQALESGLKAPAFVMLRKIRQALDSSWDDLLKNI